MEAVCQPKPAGKILEMVTSAVTAKRLAKEEVLVVAGAVAGSAAVASADLVQECVYEDVELKQQVLQKLDGIVDRFSAAQCKKSFVEISRRDLGQLAS